MSNSLSRRLRTTLFYALRTAFRLTPMPQRTRDRMRECFLDTKGHWVPEGPRGQAPSGDLPRRPYVRSDERAIGYVDKWLSWQGDFSASDLGTETVWDRVSAEPIAIDELRYWSVERQQAYANAEIALQALTAR